MGVTGGIAVANPPVWFYEVDSEGEALKERVSKLEKPPQQRYFTPSDSQQLLDAALQDHDVRRLLHGMEVLDLEIGSLFARSH